jgi:NhaP-type Na+/H+ or K+/H+ antiporter
VISQTSVGSVETVVGLLFCAIALGLCARRAKVPYPIALVLGGLILAFVPGPPVSIDPELALTLFLPPVLYQAALATSWRDKCATAAVLTGVFSLPRAAAGRHDLVRY